MRKFIFSVKSSLTYSMFFSGLAAVLAEDVADTASSNPVPRKLYSFIIPR